ncbi:fimbrial protein [Acinetobacter sp. WU_MDCI_Axc73]|nr:fimbrial protein [Acinetobacter sp. WU_MDCI_Axc73]
MCLSKFSFLQLCLFLVFSVMGIQSSWATRCVQGQGFTSTTNIDRQPNSSNVTTVNSIRVTNSNQGAGTLLWQSPVYTTTFTCYDDYATNGTERAYLWLDDNTKTLAQAFRDTNLVIGVRYNGVDYPIDSLSDFKVDTGFNAIVTQPNTSIAQDNCNFIGKQVYGGWLFPYPTRSCSSPQTINLSYSLYIKARGSGKNYSSNARVYQAFQLDGAYARNYNGNFQEKLSNITINYIDCITNLNTQNVDLGTYYAYEDINTILRRTPFTINVTTIGQDCAKYPFVGKFTSNTQFDSTTLTASEPNMKNVIGIQIFPQDGTQPIPLDTNFDFGSSNGSTLIKSFDAGVKFLAKPTNSGAFTSILNYEVYFK